MIAGALRGKVGALLSGLITSEQFGDILSQSNVNDIAVYLRENIKGYSQFIPKIEDVHRRDLEAAIAKRYFVELERLGRYITFPRRKVMNFLKYRCKIDIAKKVLRALKLGETIEERFFPCGVGYEISLEGVSSVEEGAEIFKSEPFYSVLKSSISLLKEEDSLNKVENSLDFWYFSNLNRLIRLFGTRNVFILFKKQVDLINIMWIYRARLLFKYSTERALSLSLPFGYKIKKDSLRDLAESSSLEEFVNKIERTPYSEIFKEKENLPADYLLERKIERYIYREVKKLLRSSSEDFDLAVAYIHLLEFEMKDLITAIEAVRYKLPVEDAKKYLIRGDVLNA